MTVRRLALQIVLVPLVVGVCSYPVIAVYESVYSHRPRGVADGISLLVPAAIGVITGYAAALRWRSALRWGRWTWIPSTFMLLSSIAIDAANPLLTESFPAMYYETRGGHEGLHRAMLTFPAVSSIAYSLGVWARKRASSSQMSTTPDPT